MEVILVVVGVIGGWVSYWAVMRSEKEMPAILGMTARVSMVMGGLLFVVLCAWVSYGLAGNSGWMVLLTGLFVVVGLLVLGWSIQEKEGPRAEGPVPALAGNGQNPLTTLGREACEVIRAEPPPRPERRSGRPEAAADSARNLLADYGQVLERFTGFEVVDVGELPATKDEIKRAIHLVWNSQDAQTKDMLSGAFVMLSMFQEGVGEPIASIGSIAGQVRGIPLQPSNDDPEALTAWDEENSAAIMAIAASITTQHDKIGDWERVVTAEMMRLTDEFAAFKAEHANK